MTNFKSEASNDTFKCEAQNPLFQANAGYLSEKVRILSPEEWDRVTKIINEPAEPSQALIDLMSRKPGYIRDF